MTTSPNNLINWHRSYRVVFGTPEINNPAYIKEGVGVLKKEFATIDAETIPSNAVEMDNLTNRRGFTFTLDSTRKLASASNKNTEKTVVQLYNLNKATIEVLNQDGCVMRVYAGYGGETDLIYSGDVEQVSPTKQGNDMVHRVKCRDGAVSEKETIVSIEFPEALPTAEVIQELVGFYPDSSLGFVGLDKFKNDFITGGQSYSGKLVNIVEKVIRRNNLRQGRFNGNICIIPYDLAIGSTDYQENQFNNFVFNKTNIKSITPSSKNQEKTTSEKQTRESINVSAFLTPIELGQFFTIPADVSEKYNGTYLVNSIRTVLASTGNNWDVVVTGEPIS